MNDKLLLLVSVIALCFSPLVANAENNINQKRDTTTAVPHVVLGDWHTIEYDSIEVEPSILYVPLIFEKQEIIQDSIKTYIHRKDSTKLHTGSEWLTDAIDKRNREQAIRYRTMVNNPEIVYFNIDNLPEPPVQYEIIADPSTRTLSLEEKKLDSTIEIPDVPIINMHNWIHTFTGSVQFSQAYISENWYQGGNNNLNILGNFVWNVNLNQVTHPKLMFDNTVQYKISLNSAPQDSLRSYSISEDLLQVNTKFGYKAYHNWFYSTTLQFKTQFFNNYTPNTNTLKASFLTPGELNLGLGMTYNTKSKSGYTTFDLSLSPASYNMKICRENTRVDPTTMGVEEGRRIAGQFGSSMEGKLVWKVTATINWTSRLYAFTNYDYVQGDWENTINFSINKYLSTQIYLHLRYDNSGDIINDSWRYWQFKEILSFGLNYKFSMK